MDNEFQNVRAVRLIGWRIERELHASDSATVSECNEKRTASAPNRWTDVIEPVLSAFIRRDFGQVIYVRPKPDNVQKNLGEIGDYFRLFYVSDR